MCVCVCVCVCVTYLIYSFVSGHLDCFRVLTVAKNAAMNIGVYVSSVKQFCLFTFGCAWSSHCMGYSLVVVHKLLIVVASLVTEHRLWGTWASAVAARGPSSCGSQALGCTAEAHGLHSRGARAAQPRRTGCIAEAHGLHSRGTQV